MSRGGDRRNLAAGASCSQRFFKALQGLKQSGHLGRYLWKVTSEKSLQKVRVQSRKPWGSRSFQQEKQHGQEVRVKKPRVRLVPRQ